jgi:Family of unknown function (DUF6763)
MASLRAGVGNWYRLEGELFEVVAIDEDDATIEMQYFDGTVEEMDFEDWKAHCEERAVEQVDAPEDWTGSVDVDPDDESPSGPRNAEPDLQARSALDGLDLFEAR